MRQRLLLRHLCSSLIQQYDDSSCRFSILSHDINQVIQFMKTLQHFTLTETVAIHENEEHNDCGQEISNDPPLSMDEFTALLNSANHEENTMEIVSCLGGIHQILNEYIRITRNYEKEQLLNPQQMEQILQIISTAPNPLDGNEQENVEKEEHMNLLLNISKPNAPDGSASSLDKKMVTDLRPMQRETVGFQSETCGAMYPIRSRPMDQSSDEDQNDKALSLKRSDAQNGPEQRDESEAFVRVFVYLCSSLTQQYNDSLCRRSSHMTIIQVIQVICNWKIDQ